MEAKQYYLICYDITDAKRWRKVYKLINGYGWRLQYSIFRCRLTSKQAEKLRWQLEKLMDKEDKLLIISMCDHCERKIATYNRPESWQPEEKAYEII